MPSLLERLRICLDVRYVLSLDSLLQACESRIDSIPLVCRNLVTVILEILLALEAEGVSIIDLVHPFLLCLVRSLIGLGLVTHPLDLILAEA